MLYPSDLIQSMTDTSDCYISIIDDDFVSEDSRNTIQIMITCIAASNAGGYNGAKKRFKQDLIYVITPVIKKVDRFQLLKPIDLIELPVPFGKTVFSFLFGHLNVCS